MTRSAHRSRKPFGNARNTSPAKTSSSASEGALTGRQASGSDARSAIIVMYTVMARTKWAGLRGSDVTEAIDRDNGARRAGDARRRAPRGGANSSVADDAAEPAAAPLCAPAHRDQSAAAALPPLHRLVRIAIPAERHGALSANALLVGAGVIVIPGRGRKPANPESIITAGEAHQGRRHCLTRRWLWIPGSPLRGAPE